MALQIAPNTTHRRKCIRHGCTNDAEHLVATTRWWKLRDNGANDGMTGIVFECCEEHRGMGWKRHTAAEPQFSRQSR